MYGMWRSIKRVSSKLFMKALTLISLILLTTISAAFRSTLFVLRFAGIPIAVVSVIITGFFYFDSGSSSDLILCVAGAGIAIGMYFLLPVILDAFDTMIDSLKYYLAEPIIVRPPVKYTM